MDGGGGTSARAMTDSSGPLETQQWILGTWQLLRADVALELQAGTRMHFGADQRLEYTIPTGDRPLSVVLLWRLENGILHTQLDDGSNPVQVAVSVGDAEVMTCSFGGPRAWFVRAV